MLDIVFKLYVSAAVSRGLMIAGVALIWGVLQSLLMFNGGSFFFTDHATLFYGGFAALALTVSNLALLECLAKLPVSVASTIYRLNTIPLVLLAVIFLAEDLDGFRLAGVLVGLLTVALLHSRNSQSNSVLGQQTNHVALWFSIIIFASCVRAGYGILTKAGLNAGADADSMMLLAAGGWFVGGLVYFLLFELRRKIYLGSIHLIGAAGLLVFAVVWFLTSALSRGDASVVMPIANMGFVAAFVFSLMLKFESITLRKSMAIFSAMISIALLTIAI